MASIKLTNFTGQIEQTRRHIQYRFQRSHEALQARESLLLSRLDQIDTEYKLKSTIITNSMNSQEVDKSIEFIIDPSFEESIANLGTIKLIDTVLKRLPSHSKPIIPDYKSKQFPTAHSCGNSTSKGAGEFNSPRSLSVHRKTGNVYVVDRDNNRVQVFARSLLFLFMFSDGMNMPRGICIGRDKVFVSQYDGNCFNAYSIEGKLLGSVGVKGSGDGQFNSPLGLDTCSTTNNIYVCDRYNNRVQIFTNDLKFHTILGKYIFKSPRDVKVKRNKVFVLDCSDPCMFVFNSEHQLTNRLISRGDGKQTESSYYFDVDRVYNIIISDYQGHCVYVFDQKGEQLRIIGKEGQGIGEFYYPFGIALDSTGSIIVVCEKKNSCLQIF